MVEGERVGGWKREGEKLTKAQYFQISGLTKRNHALANFVLKV